MLKFLQQLFCKHHYVDKCYVDDINPSGKTYQEVCTSRCHNGHCKKHDANFKAFNIYCDYHFQRCVKCGKVIKDGK